MTRPRVLLADEPTGNLGSRTSLDIMDVFQRLNRDGLTILMDTEEDVENGALVAVIGQTIGQELFDGADPLGETIPVRGMHESVILCLLGGLGGIILGAAATEAIATYAGWPAMFSIEAMVVALSVSFAVGLFFGFYPAWKASRLDPIVALRQE